MSAIIELFGYYTGDPSVDWKKVTEEQFSKYTGKRSIKIRKSQPEISIGTVVIQHGLDRKNLIIDPVRFLDKGQVFVDCLHLLSNHEPGNELHLIPEVKIPGGNVDFFLASVRRGKVEDFVGIELQALDTTGSLWEERQKFLVEVGVLDKDTVITHNNFGINWKMTAKTTLVQLHHKVRTFEHLNKHFVLIVQDHLLNYMQRDFNFSAFNDSARLGDPMHIHGYSYGINGYNTHIELSSRISTDVQGLSQSLGLKAEAEVELQIIIDKLEGRLSEKTLFIPM